MTADEMNEARRKMGVSKADLARLLRTPYPTVRDWCRGERPIPGVAEVAVGLLVEREAAVMGRIVERIGGRDG